MTPVATAKTTTPATTAPTEHADAPEPAEDRVPAFKVADTAYTFPAHVPVGWGLTYLRLMYSSSPDHALTWGLMKMLGRDQYLRLEDDPELTRDAMAKEVAPALRDALLGGMEDPKD